MTPTGFESWRDYFSFSLARNYWDEKNQSPFSYSKNLLEKLGTWASSPVLVPLDWILINIHKPSFIVALSASSIALVTLAYYPNQLVQSAACIAPSVQKIDPESLKFAEYIASQLFIASIGIKALGRVCNTKLMHNWKEHKITAQPIGTSKIP